jgi:type IV secretion system protein VirD4
MSQIDPAIIRRRAANLLLGAPAALLVIGVACTQFVAYRLDYAAFLGAPVIAHAYWPWAILEWWNALWHADFTSTFNLVRLGLMGLFCVALLVVAKGQQKRPKPHPELHGTAQHMTEKDVWATGLLPDPKNPRPGILVGGWTDRRKTLRYLVHTGREHVLCLGPTRSGKTAGVLIPTLLTYPHSMIVYDPKGELYDRTAGWRKKEAGNTVIRFAPAQTESSVRWNPFDRVRAGTPYEFRDVANIIEQVADPKGKGLSGHWEPTAANFLAGVALHLFALVQRCSFGEMLEIIDDPGRDLATLFGEMIQSHNPQVAQVGQGMKSTADKERASIVSTARTLLRLYRDPVVGINTADSDFSIDNLMNSDRPVTLYIETRGEDELRMRPLVRLFLTLAIGQLISKPPILVNGEERIPHKHPMLLAIDEFASLGEMEPLEIALSKSAGAGITGLLLAQDHQQIVKAYGQNETITSHCKVISAYAPSPMSKTAEWLSDACGKSTVVVEEISESLSNGKRSQNRTLRSVPRPLMTPDEIRRLKPPKRDRYGKITDPGEMLIFQGGQVIRGTQSLWYRDPEFKRRAAIPAPVMESPASAVFAALSERAA